MKQAKYYDLMGKRVRIITMYERVVSDVGVVNWRLVKPTHTEGWITGVRYLREGKLLYHPQSVFDDSSTNFKVTNTIKCLLVVPTPWHNPVKVPLYGYNFLKGARK